MKKILLRVATGNVVAEIEAVKMVRQGGLSAAWYPAEDGDLADAYLVTADDVGKATLQLWEEQQEVCDGG